MKRPTEPSHSAPGHCRCHSQHIDANCLRHNTFHSWRHRWMGHVDLLVERNWTSWRQTTSYVSLKRQINVFIPPHAQSPRSHYSHCRFKAIDSAQANREYLSEVRKWTKSRPWVCWRRKHIGDQLPSPMPTGISLQPSFSLQMWEMTTSIPIQRGWAFNFNYPYPISSPLPSRRRCSLICSPVVCLVASYGRGNTSEPLVVSHVFSCLSLCTVSAPQPGLHRIMLQWIRHEASGLRWQGTTELAGKTAIPCWGDFPYGVVMKDDCFQ